MNKGISPIIAAVLLIAFTIAIAAIAGPFFLQTIQTAQSDTLNRTGEVRNFADSSVEISQIRYDLETGNMSITVENSGSEPLNDIVVHFIGDEIVTGNTDVDLQPKELTTIQAKIGTQEFDSVRATTGTSSVRDEQSNPEQNTDFKYLIDNFEDGDVDEYSGSSIAPYTVQSSIVKHGKYALNMSDGTTTKLLDNSTLPNHIKPGDRFSYWVLKTEESSYNRFYFGGENESWRNTYSSNLQADKVQLEILMDGNMIQLDQDTSFDPAPNVWYRAEVDWGRNGNITVNWYNSSGHQGFVTATNTTFKGQNIGFYGGHSDYFDSARLLN